MSSERGNQRDGAREIVASGFFASSGGEGEPGTWSILERITDGLVAYDRAWRFTYLNRQSERYLGRPREALLGKNVWEEYPDAVGTLYYDELHRAVAEQSPREFTTPSLISERWHGVTVYPSEDGVTVYVRDITEQRRAAEAMRLLGAASRVRDEILRIVSHDLRDPLHNIGLAVQLILMSEQPPRMKHHLCRIQRSVAMANHLIEDLLDMARIETGKLALDRQDHEVDPLIREAVDLVRAGLEQKSVEVLLEIEPSLPMIFADRYRLLQVLGNLLGNAAKYASGGGWVCIKAARDGERVQFSVEDNGPGIPDESLERVFDRFWQAKDPKHAGDGLGLGLAIAKAVVEAHGGAIWVESPQGKGAAFHFTCPVGDGPGLAHRPTIPV